MPMKFEANAVFRLLSGGRNSGVLFSGYCFGRVLHNMCKNSSPLKEKEKKRRRNKKKEKEKERKE